MRPMARVCIPEYLFFETYFTFDKSVVEVRVDEEMDDVL